MSLLFGRCRNVAANDGEELLNPGKSMDSIGVENTREGTHRFIESFPLQDANTEGTIGHFSACINFEENLEGRPTMLRSYFLYL